MDVLKHVGYQILWQRVLDSAEFGCVTRIRWLAMAVRRHASDVEIPQFENWPKVETIASGHPQICLCVPCARYNQGSEQRRK